MLVKKGKNEGSQVVYMKLPSRVNKITFRVHCNEL